MIDERPRLEFFRNTPAGFLERPPLASSLQSFESCLFLVALDRYPHAFSSCVFSVESAVKAGLRIAAEDRTDLQELLRRARRQVPAVASLPEDVADRLRRTRNRIVHYGFSPKDDNVTAALILEGGIPLLRAVYSGFFQFDLHDGLRDELADHLNMAAEVFNNVKSRADVPLTGCFVAVGHLIRRGMRKSAASAADEIAAQRGETIGLHWEAVADRKSRLERLLEPSCTFDCPVCFGPDSLVCELAKTKLTNGEISIVRAICAECDLHIPATVPTLADILCARQIEQRSKDILREYGIT